MIPNLYLAIAERLRTAPIGIQTINLYNQQLTGSDELPLHCPAVYIRFTDIQWTNHTNGAQKGEALIRIHIAQENYTTSDFNQGGGTPTNPALEVLLFVTNVSQILHNYMLTGSGIGASWSASPLKRTSTNTDHDHDYLHHHIVEFTTTIIDCTINPNPNTGETITITHTVTANEVPTPPTPDPSPYTV